MHSAHPHLSGVGPLQAVSQAHSHPHLNGVGPLQAVSQAHDRPEPPGIPKAFPEDSTSQQEMMLYLLKSEPLQGSA